MLNGPGLKPGMDNYAVMGNPVAHSKSPQIHTAFASQTGQKLHYQAIEVEIGDFPGAVAAFWKEGGMGLNITVPFKGDACAAATHLTERARRAQAVNTMRFDNDGQCFGDTTDGMGLLQHLTENHAINLAGIRILILGAGGAVRGVLDPLLDASPVEIVIVNRTLAKARELANAFSDRGRISACDYETVPARRYDLMINGTSASLDGQVPPLPETVKTDGTICYDMMYSIATATPFVRWARERGVVAAYDGLGMLVEQAAISFEIWRGIRPQTRPVIEMLRQDQS